MQQDKRYIGIGVFVFCAVLLVIASALFFYSQYVQGKRETYVMLFRGSLTGLDANSSVTYRGVRVGRVKRIELTANTSNSTVAIPVYVEFFVEKTLKYRSNPIQVLINKNIVADITSPNILTNTASIELVPAGPKQVPFRVKTFHGTPRFPTDSTLADEAQATDTFRTLRTTLHDLSNFLQSKELNNMIGSIRAMANSVDVLSKTLENQVPNTLATVKDSLNELSKAAYSTRSLTDYLFRHPESLLRGK